MELITQPAGSDAVARLWARRTTREILTAPNASIVGSDRISMTQSSPRCSVPLVL